MCLTAGYANAYTCTRVDPYCSGVILHWATTGQDVVNKLLFKRSVTRIEVHVAERTADI